MNNTKTYDILKCDLIDVSIVSLSLVAMLPSITIISQIPYLSSICNLVNAVNYLFLAIVIAKKKYRPRLILAFIVIASILLYGYIQSGMSAFFTAWFLLYALKGYNFDRIVADIHLSIFVVLLLALIFGLFSLNDINSQIETGFHLGMGQKNVLGFYIFEYYITGLFIKKTQSHFIVKTELTGLLVLLITRCKTAAALLVILPFFLLLNKKIMKLNLYKIYVILIELIVPSFLLSTYMTAKLFPVSSWVQAMNRFTTNRIFLNWFILSKNHLTLFGQNVQLSYYILYNDIINQWNITTTVDGTYITMLLLLGLIPTIIFAIGYIALIHKAGVCKNYLIVTIAGLLAIYALMETRFTSIIFNFVFFYLTANIRDSKLINETMK